MSVKQILVVDDSSSWLHFVRGLLELKAEFNVIATATNGTEAIEKARELQPNVVLMDLGLPGMNGFEATRQIRQISPASKIVFLSEQRDSDLIEAAFQAGGMGYILKSDSYFDLLAAIGFILRDRRFVSHSLRIGATPRIRALLERDGDGR